MAVVVTYSEKMQKYLEEHTPDPIPLSLEEATELAQHATNSISEGDLSNVVISFQLELDGDHMTLSAYFQQ